MAQVHPDPTLHTDILIVDADTAIGESMQLLFSTAGFTAMAVNAVGLADDAVFTYRPRCLVIAAEMTPVAGVEWLAAMRRKGISIPAIIVASRGDVPTAVAAMRAGASDFLEKPLVDARLLQSVRRLLQAPGHQVTAS